MNAKSEGQIFVCEKCGNEVIVTDAGGGELKCCDQPMKLIEQKIDFETEDMNEEESE
jgi:desulfoferrodoxin-like iron-binding protein